MKLFKIVLSCAVVCVLILSLTLNLLLLCGFSFAKAEPSTPPAVWEKSGKPEDKKPSVHHSEEDKKPSVHHSEEDKKSDSACGVLVYSDNNVKAFYLSREKREGELVHLFRIENNSDSTLTVLFCDLYIDGRQVFVSGLTAEHLLPDSSSAEELVLSVKDGIDINTFPRNISFKIKLINDKSKLDLYESDRITLEF